jgi:hypothetical protein
LLLALNFFFTPHTLVTSTYRDTVQQSDRENEDVVRIPWDRQPQVCPLKPELAIFLTVCRYDLRATFEIVVGKSPSPEERFTVHTHVLTQRSRFLRAARKPEWLTDASNPVDLTDEDPDVFQAYLNCVYFGFQTLHAHIEEFDRQMANLAPKVDVYCVGTMVNEASVLDTLQHFGTIKNVQSLTRKFDAGHLYHVEFATTEGATRARAHPHGHILNWHTIQTYRYPANREKAEAARSGLSDAGCEALIKTYLLADKLQDPTTVNLVLNGLIGFIGETTEIPKQAPITLAYNSTVSGNPLRTLLRDYWVYQMPTGGITYLEGDGFPKDFLQDVATELMRLRLGLVKSEGCNREQCSDKCQYHQHDDEHPRCGKQ